MGRWEGGSLGGGVGRCACPFTISMVAPCSVCCVGPALPPRSCRPDTRRSVIASRLPCARIGRWGKRVAAAFHDRTRGAAWWTTSSAGTGGLRSLPDEKVRALSLETLHSVADGRRPAVAGATRPPQRGALPRSQRASSAGRFGLAQTAPSRAWLGKRISGPGGCALAVTAGADSRPGGDARVGGVLPPADAVPSVSGMTVLHGLLALRRCGRPCSRVFGMSW